MTRFRPYVLPLAIVLGLLFHTQSVLIAWLVPYVIFLILMLNFTAVDLRSLKFNRLDLWIMIFQAGVSIGGYYLIKGIWGNEDLAQGWLIAVLCPVASSVVVVASVLGADRRITTGYTIYGNLLVSAIAPLYFSFIGTQQDMPFWDSASMIFMKIFTAIALPFFLVFALQLFAPKVKSAISRFKEWAFLLWAFALMETLGQTIDYIFLYHEGNESTILWLGVIGLVCCVMQFGCGRLMGSRIGETIAAGQLTGQKNSSIGIWMASIFLNPLSSVGLAFYSIFQNLYNSWQMWRVGKK